MTALRLARDPLWQCLCPIWSQTPLRSISTFASKPRRRPSLNCLHRSHPRPRRNVQSFSSDTFSDGDRRQNPTLFTPGPPPIGSTTFGQTSNKAEGVKQEQHDGSNTFKTPHDLFVDAMKDESNDFLHSRMRSVASKGEYNKTRWLVEFLIKKRGEAPSMDMYNAMILVNVDHSQGAAWRVTQLLDEMAAEGLQPDLATCNAVLRVLSVHPDHLLRSDVLHFMAEKWWRLSDDASHHVAAGLFREGLFEQAIGRLNQMRNDGIIIESWLHDLAVVILCEAGEVEEAYRIMRLRMDAGEHHISSNVWYALLDRASRDRHHAATSMVWMTHVNADQINPSSGICFNVLATAARGGDAALATEVFARLSRLGTKFQRIHFELLVSTYLAADPPDLKRAMNVLTIMTLEKLEPSMGDTRPLYLYLRDKPAAVQSAFGLLRDLHEQGRNIPIAVINVLIECLVEQGNVDEAMKIYKVIHTFAPIGKGAQKSFANVETFNLLLKGCRLGAQPNARRAAFLVSELLILRVVPNALTYDRLILVLVGAANAVTSSASSPAASSTPTSPEDGEARSFLDWSFRHFVDMQSQGLMLRFGTIEQLAQGLARIGDERCWDVVQAAKDNEAQINGFAEKERWLRRNVEKEWEQFENMSRKGPGDVEGSGERVESIEAVSMRSLANAI